VLFRSILVYRLGVPVADAKRYVIATLDPSTLRSFLDDFYTVEGNAHVALGRAIFLDGGTLR
jgi:hypothetical protein